MQIPAPHRLEILGQPFDLSVSKLIRFPTGRVAIGAAAANAVIYEAAARSAKGNLLSDVQTQRDIAYYMAD